MNMEWNPLRKVRKNSGDKKVPDLRHLYTSDAKKVPDLNRESVARKAPDSGQFYQFPRIEDGPSDATPDPVEKPEAPVIKENVSLTGRSIHREEEQYMGGQGGNARIKENRGEILRHTGAEEEEEYIYMQDLYINGHISESVAREPEDSGKKLERAAESKPENPRPVARPRVIRRATRVDLGELRKRATGADTSTDSPIGSSRVVEDNSEQAVTGIFTNNSINSGKRVENNNRPILEDKAVEVNRIPVSEDTEISEKLVAENIKINERDISGRKMYYWGDGLDEKRGLVDRERVSRAERSGGAISGLHQPNDDACFAEPDSSAFGVFDGVGGKAGSHAASRLASNHFRTGLKALPDDMSPQEVGEKMQELYEGARQEMKKKYPDKEIATTVSVFKTVIYKEQIYGVALNVGDSRITRLSAGANKLSHMTNDAGVDKEENWNIQKEIAELKDFKNVRPPLRKHIDQRHILRRALSNYGADEQVKPDLHVFKIESGDKIVITSDGIHDNLDDADIIACVKDKDTDKAARDLVLQAEIKSHEKDEYLRAKAHLQSLNVAKYARAEADLQSEEGRVYVRAQADLQSLDVEKYVRADADLQSLDVEKYARAEADLQSKGGREYVRAQADLRRLEEMQYSRAKPDDMTALVIHC